MAAACLPERRRDAFCWVPMIADLGMTADADDAEMARTAATDTRENFIFNSLLVLQLKLASYV